MRRTTFDKVINSKMNHNTLNCGDHYISKGSHALYNFSNILALHCNSVIPSLFSLLFQMVDFTKYM